MASRRKSRRPQIVALLLLGGAVFFLKGGPGWAARGLVRLAAAVPQAAATGDWRPLLPAAGGRLLFWGAVGLGALVLVRLFARRARAWLELHAPGWAWVPYRSRIFKRAPSRFEYGWVYVLTNPSMSGLVKVGSTQDRPKTRAKELSTTGVATPFRVAFAARSGYARRIEMQAHRLLAPWRVNDKREFFRRSPKEAIKAIRAAEHQVKAAR